MRNDAAYVADIAQACRHISDFVAGIAEDHFLESILLQSAVSRQIEIIGEAARRLSHEYRDCHEAVPRKRIIGMRDRLIHGYDDIHLGIVWKVANEEVPILLKHLEGDWQSDDVGNE